MTPVTPVTAPQAPTTSTTDLEHSFVLGFLFEEADLDHQLVVVIKKTKPYWQAGKFNGVGGHIKAGESPHQAMIREFHEETGVFTCVWHQFALMTYHNGDKVWCYAAADNQDVDNCATQGVEEIYRMDRDHLRERAPTLPNIRWLADMALAKLKHPSEPVLEINYPQQ